MKEALTFAFGEGEGSGSRGRRRNRMVGQQYLTTGHTCFGFAAEVEHDLEKLAGMDALVKRPREVGRDAAVESYPAEQGAAAAMRAVRELSRQ